MGVFSDNVAEFYDHGLICIPVGDNKAPIISNWQKWCETDPGKPTVELWEQNFSQVQKIGLCVGVSTKLVAFDWDYAFDPKRSKIDAKLFQKDKKTIEQKVFAMLPQTPARKIGLKGVTQFYRWNERLDNVCADRNGVRMFDFLAWHKQTILPPSLHSVQDGNPLYYRWDGPPIQECLDDIPEIDMDLILEIKALFGESSGAVKNSRHDKLFRWILSMATIEKDPAKLVPMLLEKDKAMNAQDPKGLYLTDKLHSGGVSAEQFASKWVERTLKWKSNKADRAQQNGGGRARDESDDDVWNYFFETSFPILRKDIMSERVMIKRDPQSKWVDILNVEGVLKSYARSRELPASQVKDEIERFTFERQRLEFLCDLPEWDGVDRVSLFGNAVNSSRFSCPQISEIFKHWGSGIFRRIDDSQNQNRCLLLKGGQGLGKDTMVKAMLKDFTPYFETAALNGTQKDVYELISRLYVLHIEEFDQTKNLDIAFIKSILTQSSAFFRESYGRSPSNKTVAVNFISTANVDDILRDPTGNRRFIVLPVEGIKWNYPQGQSAQILAQFKHYAATNQHATLTKDVEAVVQEIILEYTPPDPFELMVEVYKNRMRQMLREKGVTCLALGECGELIADVAKRCGYSPQALRRVLSSRHLSRRTMDGYLYYAGDHRLITKK